MDDSFSFLRNFPRAFEVEGEAKSDVVGAEVRITVDSMRTSIVQHVTAMLSKDMPKVIEAAVIKALDNRNWEAEIATLVKASVDKLTKECVEQAVDRNYELKSFIRKQIGDAISKIVV